MAALAVAAMFAAAVPANAAVARIKCESWNFQPASCPVDRIDDVRLVERQGGDCRQGRDWRYDRRAISVFNGCRAVFEVRYSGNYGGGGYPPPPPPQGVSIRCESWQYQPQRCPANTSGGVRITRVLGGDCQQGRTWGWDRGGIWVNGGCRAEFVTMAGGYPGGPGGGYPGGGYGGTIVECNSRNYQPARCPAVITRGVEIDRVLGGECIERRSWGWDGGAIWVNNGCRARFRVY